MQSHSCNPKQIVTFIALFPLSKCRYRNLKFLNVKQVIYFKSCVILLLILRVNCCTFDFDFDLYYYHLKVGLDRVIFFDLLQLSLYLQCILCPECSETINRFYQRT